MVVENRHDSGKYRRQWKIDTNDDSGKYDTTRNSIYDPDQESHLQETQPKTNESSRTASKDTLDYCYLLR